MCIFFWAWVVCLFGCVGEGCATSLAHTSCQFPASNHSCRPMALPYEVLWSPMSPTHHSPRLKENWARNSTCRWHFSAWKLSFLTCVYTEAIHNCFRFPHINQPSSWQLFFEPQKDSGFWHQKIQSKQTIIEGCQIEFFRFSFLVSPLQKKTSHGWIEDLFLNIFKHKQNPSTKSKKKHGGLAWGHSWPKVWPLVVGWSLVFDGWSSSGLAPSGELSP